MDSSQVSRQSRGVTLRGAPKTQLLRKSLKYVDDANLCSVDEGLESTRFQYTAVDTGEREIRTQEGNSVAVW